MRLLIVLMVAGLAGCGSSDPACDVNAPAHCEGMVLVSCTAPAGSAMVAREDCVAERNICLARADGAACVARDVPCDPATTAKQCADTRYAEVCETLFGAAPTGYPRTVDSECTEAAVPFCFDARKACGKLN